MKTTSTEIQPESTLTCPGCGTKTTETMPETSCLYFWECPACGKMLKPEEGDCCVFCTYGDVPCPPVQQVNNCCR